MRSANAALCFVAEQRQNAKRSPRSSRGSVGGRVTLDWFQAILSDRAAAAGLPDPYL